MISLLECARPRTYRVRVAYTYEGRRAEKPYVVTPPAEYGVRNYAANSPKGFAAGKTDPEPPCGKKPEDAEALIVYYNDVFNYSTHQVEDFDVTLRVSPTELENVQWTKFSGPDSGSLVDASESEATFRNPTKGGVYQFDAAVAGSTTRAQLWLPLAGPDITQWFDSEVAHLHSFASAYHESVGSNILYRVPGLGITLRTFDFGPMAAGADWLGQFTSPSSPCGGPVAFNVHDARHTVAGIVVERHKLSNILVAYVGRDLTRWSENTLTEFFTRFGTWDDPYARASYQIGFDIYSGTSVEAAFAAHGYDAQAPESWAPQEWPSQELPTGGGITRPAAFE